MYTRMVRAFVGIGSVDTVVAPDSALVGLVGVAGPVATPSAAACLPLQLIQDVHDLRRVSVILSPRSLTGNAARSSRYLYNEILAFYKNNVLYEVCPGRASGRALHLAKVSILLTVSD